MFNNNTNDSCLIDVDTEGDGVLVKLRKGAIGLCTVSKVHPIDPISLLIAAKAPSDHHGVSNAYRYGIVVV